jgi:paraquat-inducible protein B
MSKASNPATIGAFVIGAIALLVVAVLVFGGSELFAKKLQAVSYFPGSVKGLRVGSNVTFRGVRIGYIESIQILGDVDTLETVVEVVMEISRDSFTFTSEGRILDQGTRPDLDIQDAINAGLRAQLNLDSFVTGQLLVDLDFLPETPPIYRSENPPYVEIPIVPSDIQQALERFRGFVEDFREKVDVDKLFSDIQNIISGLEKLVNSPDIEESLAGLNRFINDEDTQELTGSLRIAVSDLRATLQDARQLVNNADAQIEPVVDQLLPAISRLDSLLKTGEETLSAASMQIKGESELSYELTKTLSEVQGAARSLRLFLDYMERNPEALIRGKQP